LARLIPYERQGIGRTGDPRLVRGCQVYFDPASVICASR
jgi:hypothetical protein